MKIFSIGIFVFFAFAGLSALADGTVAVNTTNSLQIKEIVEKMRGLDMRLGNTRMDDLSPNPIEEYKRGIIDELRSVGQAAIPALVQALNDPDAQMRCNAELVMIFIGGGYDDKPKMDIAAALPALIKSTGDTNSDVRAWAAHAIAEIGPGATNAIPVLIKLLSDPDVGPRNDSCIALHAIGPAAREALPALQKALNDPNPDVRRFAKWAIEKIESGRN